MATQFANGKIVTDGLVLCLDAADLNSYPTTGTTWFDLAGSNNGTLTNGPTFSGRGASSSIVFDGTNDYIVGTLTVPSSFTFSVTLKPTSFTQWSPEFNIWPNYPGANRGWDIFCIHSGNVGSTGIYAGTDVGTRWSPSETGGMYILNELQTITFTHSNGTSMLYRNGVLKYQKAQNSPLYIGQTKYYTLFCNPTYGTGELYTSQIYNRALSATEVLQNYNAQKARFGIS